jgi:hypothetical protein
MSSLTNASFLMLFSETFYLKKNHKTDFFSPHMCYVAFSNLFNASQLKNPLLSVVHGPEAS